MPTMEEFMEELEAAIKNRRLRDQCTMPDRAEFIEEPEAAIENRRQGCKSRNKTFVVYLVAFLIVVSCFIYIVYTQTNANSDLMEVLTSSNQHANGLLGGQIQSDNTQKHYLNIGMRQDYLLQECQGTHFKLSFPDIDYALMGYNILRGFPLATGHDPGFTYPIFAANYENEKQTADCRYSVPQGLVVVPDVSCITSFTSKVVQTQYEFANSLSVSASVSGSGWGLSFSASADYKASSSQISTGESVYILSSASCSYYFSKLVKRSPPPLDPVFLSWVKRLSSTNSTDVYLEFLDTYGTHFPTEVTFGARFTYEHKMESKKYETQIESGVNVEASASYSGFFNVGGGFSMDSSQKLKASAFSKSVETKTISVGAAPPANGDAMTWALTVKDSPVPTSYKLASIEELFTEKYMNPAELTVNLAHIAKTINKTKHAYCQSMISKGEVESCQSLTPGMMLDGTRLYHYYDSIVSTYKECIDHCLKLIDCVAITYCDTCDRYRNYYQTCYMYSTVKKISGDEGTNWKSMFLIGKSSEDLILDGTDIKGTKRELDVEDLDDERNINSTKCKQLCIDDPHCIAYSYCDCDEVEQKCKIYSFENIGGLKRESRTTTVFVAK
ncbi:uncharacterized protein LOC132722694 isoform X2 [Ruditapes philippinarum]|uniref:uncharacterized protein LOC132722694 isoform X2 n=1 Tax=Ruditapes philippinarum TaxID=129788 RepID=UPI00295BD4E2|nr:uncharacterized protein LOC132722694 isoform X2 [Ruditapes philippinarum]